MMFLLFYLTFLFISLHGSQSDEFNGQIDVPHINYGNKYPSSEPYSSSCPAAEDIAPCVCVIKYGDINLDCSGVTSNKQLRDIFHKAHFPIPNFREFYMANNKNVTILEKQVFGNVTFKVIFIMRSAIQTVEVGAFDSCKKTAIQIDLISNNITSFPFETVGEFQALEELRLDENRLPYMPVIESKTVKMIDLSFNPLMTIPVEALRSLTAIEFIAMTFANISSIPPGLFQNVTSLQYVLLGYNNITSLPTNIITCSSSEVHCGNYWLKSVNLAHNPISKVYPHAFEVHSGLHVDITGTRLTTLNETVWRPLVEANITLSLEDTPLACGCDMAWLAINPPNLKHVFGDCSNGNSLQHLDPKDFANCTSSSL